MIIIKNIVLKQKLKQKKFLNLNIKKYITSHAQGKVLETMCGFNSYFGNSKKINEVVVLDYCREMLERYARPERTRILYDLNKVIAGEKLDFFKEGEFQTIGCWGSNYLTNPVPVFSEFHRILSKTDNLNNLGKVQS